MSYAIIRNTKDKKGNDIDKLACSEFWKAKDSYRQLQDAFYKYMVENGFNLQRGLPKEERRNQILLLIGFFIVLFIIVGIGEFIRHKFNKKK